MDGRGAEAHRKEVWPTGGAATLRKGSLELVPHPWRAGPSGHIHEGQVPGPSPENLDTHTDPRMLESKTYSLEQRPPSPPLSQLPPLPSIQEGASQEPSKAPSTHTPRPTPAGEDSCFTTWLSLSARPFPRRRLRTPRLTSRAGRKTGGQLQR